MDRPTAPLQFLMPGWFSIVMGLCGLSLAWHRATPLLGEMAGAAALVVGVFAGLVFAVLAALSVWRWNRFPEAVAEDLGHPVRHAFVAAIPISVILLATVGTALAGPTPLANAAWMVGSAAQFGVTVWALARWLKPRVGGKEGTPFWPGITPALFIPVVGNVLPPLAGVTLGHAEWATAQFGVGLFFWPAVLTLMVVRIGTAGLWPERLLPTTFITIAPPAVIGLAALQLGGPVLVAWGAWGIALFFAAWAATVLKRSVSQAFGIPFWALSFPLAALTALTLRLSTEASGAFQALAMALLALSTLVVLALLLATIKGLRNGSLLVPEPAPAINTPAKGTP
jgi:tellurite resistance protein